MSDASALPDLKSYEHITVESDGHVAVLTLDEPKKLNAMDTAMLDDMLEAICSTPPESVTRPG